MSEKEKVIEKPSISVGRDMLGEDSAGHDYVFVPPHIQQVLIGSNIRIRHDGPNKGEPSQRSSSIFKEQDARGWFQIIKVVP
jgi:hypothetical protein